MNEATCRECGRPTIVARVPWRPSSLATMTMRFSSGFHEAYIAPGVEPQRAGRGPSFLGVIVGLLEDGTFVAGELTARAALRDAPRVQMRVPHDAVCSVHAGRRQTPPHGERARCRGCEREIYWILTPNGKRAPLDPEAHTGVRLSKSEARSARGSKGYVIGLDADGEQHAIREGEQLSLLGGAEQVLVTLWVNHFATCPRRQDYVQRR